MSQQTDSGFKTFIAGETLAINRRVKQDSTAKQVKYSDSTDDYVGVTQEAVSSGDHVNIKLRTAPGTMKMTCAGGVQLNDLVYAATDGKIDDVVTTYAIGRALEAATANNDVIEVLPGGQATLDSAGLLIAAAESELLLVSVAVVAVDSQLLLIESEAASNDSEILILESTVSANTAAAVSNNSEILILESTTSANTVNIAAGGASGLLNVSTVTSTVTAVTASYLILSTAGTAHLVGKVTIN